MRKTITIFVILLISMSLAAQYNYFYYGKNKVNKERLKWEYAETPHFKIHYYIKDKQLIKKIARAAESGYASVSEYLNIKISKKIPIIFYASRIDFQLTNILGYVPRGAIAFAQSTSYRLVIQGDDSFDSLKHTITHELGHIFEYELIGLSREIGSTPTWVMEGFSDFVTQQWEPFNLLTVRDAVLNDNIPVVAENGRLMAQGGSNRTPYDFGHMMYEFMDEKFGKRGIRSFLKSMKSSRILARKRNLFRVLDYDVKKFNFEFKKFARKRFKRFLLKENPDDYHYSIGPDFPYRFSFSHQLSPSGELIAVLTVNQKAQDIDIVLMSAKDGKVIKNITPGLRSQYDSIDLMFYPSYGNTFAWNHSSDTMVFFARQAYEDYLILIEALSGKILKKVKLPAMQQPTSPCFHPDGKTVYFTGSEKTKSYIYTFDIETRQFKKISDGTLFIKAIDISPDGNQLLFSAEYKGLHKLYTAPVSNPNQPIQLTDGPYNDIAPSYSKDGRYIYYSSNELESYNIYAIDTEEKMLYRYTDVKTGNFFPKEIPSEKGKLLMSSYYKGSFTLYKLDISEYQEKRKVTFSAFKPEEEVAIASGSTEKSERAEKTISSSVAEKLDLSYNTESGTAPGELDIRFKGKYRPFSKLYLKSLPPISISYGSYGGFWGNSYLTMTDLMGDHDFTLYLANQYGSQSYHLYYLNRKSRLQLFAHLFSYRDGFFYYDEYSRTRYLTLWSSYGAELGFWYPFSREYRFEATLSTYNTAQGEDLEYLGYFEGWAMPLRLSLVGETTVFAQWGPLKGHTFRFSYTHYLKAMEDFRDAYTLQGDIRKYFRLDNYTLLAFRLNGFYSGGALPNIYFSGGDNTIRSRYYRSMYGNTGFFFNAELRFQLVHLMATPIGLMGPVRGVFFFDVGGVWFNDEEFNFFKDDQNYQLDDAVSSFGFGIEFFLFGYPMHVEWVYETDFKKQKHHGVKFWIGFDF